MIDDRPYVHKSVPEYLRSTFDFNFWRNQQGLNAEQIITSVEVVETLCNHLENIIKENE